MTVIFFVVVIVIGMVVMFIILTAADQELPVPVGRLASLQFANEGGHIVSNDFMGLDGPQHTSWYAGL